MKNRTTLYTWLMLLIFTSIPTMAQVEVDPFGARVLSELPPPGTHPRLYFTAEELPQIKWRMDSTQFGQAFQGSIQWAINSANNNWTEFAALSMDPVTPEMVATYFKNDGGRNIQWGIASVFAVAYEDQELMELMINIIVNYAKLILSSKQMYDDGVTSSNPDFSSNISVWSHNRWDLGVGWRFGATGYPVAYDILHNDMTVEQRATVRQAIATATSGRRSYGMDMPEGYAVSNHYGYHADLGSMLAVIEGEEGFDQATFDKIVKVMKDYWRVGFSEMGYCREDGYGPDLGLREGSRFLLVLARRGFNVFQTEKYQGMSKSMAMDYEPFENGRFLGGASGGPYTSLYPASTVMMRYMRPTDPYANIAYRQYFGDNMDKNHRWQSRLSMFLFGGDWTGPTEKPNMWAQSGLPLSVFYPERGKLISRSDWSDTALYFSLDARPDAFTIGHDRTDRGNFLLSALGRSWATAGNFREWVTSDEHSLVHIDGVAEAWKAPSVKFLYNEHYENSAIGGVDLKYAYDWEWTPPWPKVDGNFDASWSTETANPIDLGWPAEHAPSWLPTQIFGSESGYGTGVLNGMRKKEYNPVLKAFRSAIAIKGPHPYVVIGDDIQKDQSTHSYEWYMQVPLDLSISAQNGRDIILKEEQGDRLLLVRVLRAEDGSQSTPASIDANLEEYNVMNDTQGKRLILSVNSVAPFFRIMLFPHRTNTPLPGTNLDDGTLTVDINRIQDQIEFHSTDTGLIVSHNNAIPIVSSNPNPTQTKPTLSLKVLKGQLKVQSQEPIKQFVKLELFNITGKLLYESKQTLQKERSTVLFNTPNQNGSNIFWFRITTPTNSKVGKIFMNFN